METDATLIVDRFMPSGRLQRLPSKQAKRLVVLDHLAQRFEPGRRYREKEVDEILLGLLVPREDGGEADHVSIRRYLVDYRLLHREAGEYWRSGGWVAGS